MKRLILIFFAFNVLGFAILSHSCSRTELKQHLERTVQRELSGREEFSRIKFETQDLDVILSGQVPTANAKDELVAQLRKELSSGRVREHLKVVAPIPAHLTARLDQGILRFEGELPSESLIQELEFVGRNLGFSVLTMGLSSAEHVEEPVWSADIAKFVKALFEGADSATLQVHPDTWRIRRQTDTAELAKRLRENAITSLPKGVKLIDQLTIRPPELPSRLHVARVGDEIVATGKVPGEAHRAFIIRALTQALDEKVRNDLDLDRQTQPPDWLPALSHVMPVLFTEEGTEQVIEVEANQVRLSGKLATKEELEEVLAVVGTAFGIGYVLESGMEVAPELRPAPSHLELIANLTEEGLKLAGVVPTGETRDRIIGAFRRAFPKVQVSANALKLDARVTDPAWLDPMLDLISRLEAHLVEPVNLRVVENKAEISGMAKTRNSCQAIGLKMQRMFGGEFIVENRTAFTESLAQIGEPWTQNAIYFNSGSSRISTDQLGKLDYAALDFRNTGPNAVILIEGFADRSGSREQNLSLSNRRAQSVRQAFITRKVPPAALKIVGVSIVQSSGSPDLDRRVEYTIIP